MTKTKDSFELGKDIITLFKWYGRVAAVEHPESTVSFKDVNAIDYQHHLICQLSELLAVSDWNSEIQEYIYYQLREEINDCFTVSKSIKDSLSDSKLNRQQWLKVRDGLADVWDWWIEEHLLRYQFSQEKPNVLQPPYIEELLKLCLTLDRDISLHDLDSKLGEAFFFLTVVIHHLILQQESKNLNPSFINSALFSLRNKYQTETTINNVTLIRFAPGGKAFNRFVYVCSRINASKVKADKPFPSFTYMASVDLSAISLNLIDFRGTNLSNANLTQADLYGAVFSQANLSKANLSFVILNRINLNRANLTDANLLEASFSRANLAEANLERARLDHLDFAEANLMRVNLNKATLDGAIFCRANLLEAKLNEASLSGANLSEANLSEASLIGANLTYSSLSKANLHKADLKGSNLEKAHLNEANLNYIEWDKNTNWLNVAGLDSAIDVSLELKKHLQK